MSLCFVFNSYLYHTYLSYLFVTIIFSTLLVAGCNNSIEEVSNIPSKPSAPVTVINPTESYFVSPKSVTLSCTDKDNDCAATYFTIDNTDPQTIPEHLYQSGFTIDEANV